MVDCEHYPCQLFCAESQYAGLKTNLFSYAPVTNTWLDPHLILLQHVHVSLAVLAYYDIMLAGIIQTIDVRMLCSKTINLALIPAGHFDYAPPNKSSFSKNLPIVLIFLLLSKKKLSQYNEEKVQVYKLSEVGRQFSCPLHHSREDMLLDMSSAFTKSSGILL